MPANTITTIKTTRKYRRKGRQTKRTVGKYQPRKMRVRTYSFFRGNENLLACEAPTDGWIASIIDNSIVKTFAFNLGELPNNSEFANLYRQYKLNYAVIKMFPSYSSVVSTTGSVVSNNLIITMWPNTDGKALDSSFQDSQLLEKQSKRQFMMPQNKPLTLKMPLFQLRNTYGGAVLNPVDYAVAKPKYISTTEPNAPHYGINVHIRKVDGSAFASDSARFLIKEKIYFTCRQVQ